MIAEVALDLADDVRRRVGGELDAAVDIEAIDRLDQTNSGARASAPATCSARSAVRARPDRPARDSGEEALCP
jgi:hypothetical protein